jgi:membrane protease YdiL (CAAX protease family)
MKPSTVLRARPFPSQNRIFFNQRGLRTGWLLLIFIPIPAAALVFLKPYSYASIQILLSYEILRFLSVVFATWVMSRIEHRRMGEYGLPFKRVALPRFVSGYVLWGILPVSALLLVMRALHVYYFGPVVLHLSQAAYWGAAWGSFYLFAGPFEEYLFRGYVLTMLAERAGFWPAATILSALFGLVHMTNPGEGYIGAVNAALFGIFACATLFRTGNLWLAAGAHVGWDWATTYFYGTTSSGMQFNGSLRNPHIAGPDWLSGGSVGPDGSILATVLLVLMTVFVLLMFRQNPTQK